MSIHKDDFTTSSDEFAARIDDAVNEVIDFVNGDAMALVREAIGYVRDIEGNGPERTRANIKALVDAYPGGAIGLAGATLTVLKSVAAKRKAAKKATAPAMMRVVEDQSHPCEASGCQATVEYDDERYCFVHSPSSGSTVPGYSYKATHGTKPPAWAEEPPPTDGLADVLLTVAGNRLDTESGYVLSLNDPYPLRGYVADLAGTIRMRRLESLYAMLTEMLADEREDVRAMASRMFSAMDEVRTEWMEA